MSNYEKHTESVFNSNKRCIQALVDIHCDGIPIELDPTFNLGKFYKGLGGEPELKHDLKPLRDDVVQGDARNLLLASNCIRSMIIDPPFIFNKGLFDKNSQIEMTKKYSMYRTEADMLESYKEMINEAYRVLKDKGVLLFKCQDMTNAGKTYWTHHNVHTMLKEAGFYVKDMAILSLPGKIYNPKLKQRHLRKIHSYFFVATKTPEMVRN